MHLLLRLYKMYINKSSMYSFVIYITHTVHVIPPLLPLTHSSVYLIYKQCYLTELCATTCSLYVQSIREDHVRMSTPFSVIRIVCSNCADLDLSRDTAVQPSLKMSIGGRPSVMIGSETIILATNFHYILQYKCVLQRLVISYNRYHYCVTS